MSSNPELITTEQNDDDKEPPSSSRMLSSKELDESQKNDEKKLTIKNKINKEEEPKFIIEEDYLTLDECTAMTLGPVTINQKCYICQYCNPKKEYYICKFCYNKCHQKCRNIVKAEPKQEEYKGEKEFACYCGNKLKHKPEESQKRELKICDLLVLDKSLEVGLFFCENHQLSICCVCSVECHKKCKIRKTKNNNPQEDHQCLCINENHTTYNELALTFPLNEYQKLSGVAVWPIQILNILFNTKIFENLSNLFKAMLNKEEISEEKKKKFFPLLELFSNTFNRKFKTLYYEEDIINMFKYEKLIDYIKNIEIDSPDMILLKFRLIYILLFVHLKNDFQTTKSLTSIDFMCNNLLERIEYKKILLKKSVFNKKIYEKYNLNKLIKKTHTLKKIIINDVCNLMALGIDVLNIEEYSEDFEIGLKILCFMIKKMLFTKDDLIKLIDSLYLFFEKFFNHINSQKSNIFLIVDLFSGLSELFLMISVNYNDMIVMNYLDKYENISNINNIELKEDFIHVSSEHGNKLFEMVMKSNELLKRHYDLLNNNEDIIKENEKKLIKDKIKMQKLISTKTTKCEVKLPNSGGLFFEKIIHEFTECLGIFCLADNIYFKQIDSITKEDLISYYYFCNRINNSKFDIFNKKDSNKMNDIIQNVKIEIENKFHFLFTSSYSHSIAYASNDLNQLLLDFSSKINDILNELGDKNDINNEDEEEIDTKKLKSIKKLYIKTNNDEKGEKDEEAEEKERKIDNINHYLTKIAVKNKKIYKFLMKDSFTRVCEEFVDNLIISNLDETLTKILVFFSNRKFPNLLTIDLLDIIYSTLNLYFFSKRGLKYLLTGKILVRINKIFNRYDYKSNDKNINPAFGKTEETNIVIINKTFDFYLDLFKGMKLYELSIKNHKVLQRLRKNMLGHICLFNIVSKNNNVSDFLVQFKKMMKIFYFLSDDFEFEDLDQIKRQCVFILKQNPFNIFEKKSFYNTYNIFENNLMNNKDKESDKLALKENIKKGNKNNENNDFLNENYKKIISLYFAFFKLYGIKTYYVYENKENIAVMNILNNFNDLNWFKQNTQNNSFNLKQKIILLKYLRSVYFIDHLNEYSILLQKTHLTTMEYNTLIKSNAIVEEKFEKCLNFQQPLSLPANIVKELMDKYNFISQLEIIIGIYLNEIKNFPRQMLGNRMDLCRTFYRQLLFDIKFITNYFYCLENAWSKFNLLFYLLSLEFIPKIDIFKNVFENLKGNNDDIFDIGEEYYLVPLDRDEEEEFEHSPALKKKLMEKNLNQSLNKNEDWDMVKLEAYKTIQKLQSISFDVYNTKEIFNYLNEFINATLQYSNLGNLYNLESYLAFFDETAEANFTPFSLLETLDYEYFYEEDKQEKDELIKKDANLYKLKSLKDSFFESFIDINNTNFIDIITKVESDSLMFDPRKKYVQVFKSFINSKQGNNFHLLNILLCILAKMLFYFSEGMQDKFEDFINDEDFFPNMNRLLNMYLVLVFSLSKNIYAYNFVSEINNLSKLIIQLLQSLGEGFNTTYHNNIFKFQKDIPLIDEDSDSDSSKEGEDTKSSDLDTKRSLLKNENLEEESDENILNNLDNLKSNKIYRTKLKNEIPNVNVTKTIYDSLITNLKYALTSLDMKSLIEGEMPYDKLIISVTNIFDFLIEYIESEEENNEIIKNSFKNLLFGIKKKKAEFDKTNLDIINEKKCINVLFMKIEIDEENKDNKKLYLLRKKIICFIKYKFANLLIYYLLTGGKENMIEKLIKNNCSPIDIFSEIVYNFKELLNNLKLKNPDLVNNIDSIKKNKEPSELVNKLINSYAYEEDFRNMIEFPVVINLYILIKIFEEFYNHKELKSHFESIGEIYDETSEEDDYNIRSKFSYCVYQFLEQIILKVEIRVDNDDDEEDDQNELEEGKNKIAKLVMKNIRNDPFIHKMKAVDKKNKNTKLKGSNDDEEETESEESESEDENAKNATKTAFFLRPYLTFTLSESSKEKFIRDVDRSNASQKFISLVHFSDYCLYEMVVNRHLIGNSNVKNVLANINYFIIEVVSYLIILLNNCFIIYHFYKSPSLPIEEYDIFNEDDKSTFYADNILISLIQAAILILVVINWYSFEFINHFQYNVMELYNKNFVFKKSGEDNKISQTVIDYFQDKEDVSSHTFFSEVIKNVSGWERFYVGFFESSLFNREINIFLLTIILNILFLTIRSYLFIIVEILFIINIVPTLFDVFQAMKLKYLHIILVLLFDFLLVYVFMWFGFFFFQDFFVYDDILESSSGSTITESFCYSSVPCFLFYVSLGTRSGGGITDNIEMVSYQKDPQLFFARFFNDLLFFVLIILIMGNVFLGIIIDTFGELRDTQTENENDRNNICFICQLSSDACLTRNIDFEKHVNSVHNIWNYVYFLAYLHLNNPNNFNRVENSVWEKLEAQDYSWIPIDTSSDD